jgi:hypothetical protein
MTDFLTTRAAADYLGWKPKTLANKMHLFTQGVHYFHREGIGTRWKKEALAAWIENGYGEQPTVPVLKWEKRYGLQGTRK